QLTQLVDVGGAVSIPKRWSLDNRQVEPQKKSGAWRPLTESGRHHLCGLADDFRAAPAAERSAHTCKQKPHVVMNLGRRPDRRPRIPARILLSYCNGWRDSVDTIDIRLLHALEELPRVGRKRLDVPPLPLRINRVEGKRRLSRPAHAGHDDQLARGQD